MSSERRIWWQRLHAMVAPVFEALAAGRLRTAMPIACRTGQAEDRARYAHLEAVGRSLAGCAPWLACPAIADAEEAAARDALRARVLQGLVHLVDPAHPDAGNFSHGHQPVVDAAFLVHGLLRDPSLVDDLPQPTRVQLADRLRETRSRRPHRNNWLLFGALIEAGLRQLGAADWDPMRVDYALAAHEQWYVGDGVYGDGRRYHADYYNSFVIHPMLLDLLLALEPAPADGQWSGMLQRERERFARYAQIQERLIAADGSFPVLGRSLTYRCGAFQQLAMAALMDLVPPNCSHGSLRAALTAVIRRTLDAPGTYDDDGWLTIGLHGHQPGLGEAYISTGSCYLAATAFLPLGLAADRPFWTEAAAPWTAQRVWDESADLVPDHALRD